MNGRAQLATENRYEGYKPEWQSSVRTVLSQISDNLDGRPVGKSRAAQPITPSVAHKNSYPSVVPSQPTVPDYFPTSSPSRNYGYNPPEPVVSHVRPMRLEDISSPPARGSIYQDYYAEKAIKKVNRQFSETLDSIKEDIAHVQSEILSMKEWKADRQYEQPWKNDIHAAVRRIDEVASQLKDTRRDVKKLSDVPDRSELDRLKSNLESTMKENMIHMEGIRNEQSNMRTLIDRNLTHQSDGLTEFRRSIREEMMKDGQNTENKVKVEIESLKRAMDAIRQSVETRLASSDELFKQRVEQLSGTTQRQSEESVPRGVSVDSLTLEKNIKSSLALQIQQESLLREQLSREFKMELEGVRNSVSRLDTDLSSSKTSQGNVQAQISQEHQQVLQMQSQIQQMSTQIQSQNQTIQGLQQQLQQVQQQLQQDVLSNQSQIQQMDLKIQSVDSHASTNHSNMKTSLDYVSQQLSQQISQRGAEVTKNFPTTSDLQNLRQDILTQCQRQEEQLKDQLMRDVKGEVDTLKSRHTQMDTDLSTLRTTLSQLQQTEITTSIQRNRTNIDELSTARSQQSSQLSQMEAKVAAVEATISSLNSFQRNNVESTQQQMNGKLLSLESSSSSAISSLKNHVESLQQQLAQFQTTVQSQYSTSQQENSDFNKKNTRRIDETRDKVTELEEQLKLSVNRISEYELRFESLKKMASEAPRVENHAMNRSVQENEETTREMKRLSTETSELNRRVEKLDRKVVDLKTDLEEMEDAKNKIGEVQRALVNQSAQIGDVERRITMAADTNNSRTSQVQADIERVRGDLSEISRTSEQMERRIQEEVDRKLNIHRSPQLEGLTSTVKSLQSDLQQQQQAQLQNVNRSEHQKSIDEVQRRVSEEVEQRHVQKSQENLEAQWKSAMQDHAEKSTTRCNSISETQRELERKLKGERKIRHEKLKTSEGVEQTQSQQGLLVAETERKMKVDRDMKGKEFTTNEVMTVVSHLQEENKTIRSQLSVVEEEVGTITTVIKSCHDRIENVESLNQTISKLQVIVSDNQSSQTNAVRASQEASQAASNALRELLTNDMKRIERQAFESTTASIAAQKRMADEAAADKTKIQSEIESLRVQISKMNAPSLTQSASTSSEEIITLRSNLRSTETRLDNLAAQVSALEVSKSGVESRVRALENRPTTGDATEERKRIERLREELELIKARMEAMQEQLNLSVTGSRRESNDEFKMDKLFGMKEELFRTEEALRQKILDASPSPSSSPRPSTPNTPGTSSPRSSRASVTTSTPPTPAVKATLPSPSPGGSATTPPAATPALSQGTSSPVKTSAAPVVSALVKVNTATPAASVSVPPIKEDSNTIAVTSTVPPAVTPMRATVPPTTISAPTTSSPMTSNVIPATASVKTSVPAVSPAPSVAPSVSSVVDAPSTTPAVKIAAPTPSVSSPVAPVTGTTLVPTATPPVKASVSTPPPTTAASTTITSTVRSTTVPTESPTTSAIPSPATTNPTTNGTAPSTTLSSTPKTPVTVATPVPAQVNTPAVKAAVKTAATPLFGNANIRTAPVKATTPPTAPAAPNVNAPANLTAITSASVPNVETPSKLSTAVQSTTVPTIPVASTPSTAPTKASAPPANPPSVATETKTEAEKNPTKSPEASRVDPTNGTLSSPKKPHPVVVGFGSTTEVTSSSSYLVTFEQKPLQQKPQEVPIFSVAARQPRSRSGSLANENNRAKSPLSASNSEDKSNPTADVTSPDITPTKAISLDELLGMSSPLSSPEVPRKAEAKPSTVDSEGEDVDVDGDSGFDAMTGRVDISDASHVTTDEEDIDIEGEDDDDHALDAATNAHTISSDEEEEEEVKTPPPKAVESLVKPPVQSTAPVKESGGPVSAVKAAVAPVKTNVPPITKKEVKSGSEEDDDDWDNMDTDDLLVHEEKESPRVFGNKPATPTSAPVKTNTPPPAGRGAVKASTTPLFGNINNRASPAVKASTPSSPLFASIKAAMSPPAGPKTAGPPVKATGFTFGAVPVKQSGFSFAGGPQKAAPASPMSFLADKKGGDSDGSEDLEDWDDADDLLR
ncbi:hypothetical protein PROFUN_02108 [Planoprotostelium fungivorum]|uniref:Uncharacterized protein n=1 Tax=Planoprotostelium fungivorum TaxID=1890364 RepID=A0A2P6NZ56_9EUKA|nr:hypothetical protein PROFUN_02108 [Planoprotostelium fungivorum]